MLKINGSRKKIFTSFLKWLYLKMNADNQVGNQKA
ncbi:hypothetical protein H500_04930 [Helicobacter pylori CG-IMSS-2012]|nr:hypothetical protein H500_04930 [Helicobacter pylori CG-IMSS-2012]